MQKLEHIVLPSQSPDNGTVELFLSSPGDTVRVGAMLLVHGHQEAPKPGGREMMENGTLTAWTRSRGIVAASVSQPGYGGSSGSPDYSGPATQTAIHSALAFLKARPGVDPAKVVLYGVSRGATASAMVAAQDETLRCVILIAGAYDLAATFETTLPDIRQNVEREAGESPSVFHQRSALYHVSKIRAEILVLHGWNDDRCPADQAILFSQALQKSGVSVSLHILNCGHVVPMQLRAPLLKEFCDRAFAATRAPSAN